MKTNKADRQTQSLDKPRDRAEDYRYVADWHRKTKDEIVEDGISAIGDRLRQLSDRTKKS